MTGLAANLKASPGAARLAKTAPVIDTAAIDLLDGKLYVAIHDMNKAARRAIRGGKLGANLDEYRFHHLKPGAPARTGVARAPDAPAGTNTP